MTTNLLSGTFLLTALLLCLFTSCKKEQRTQAAEENLSFKNASLKHADQSDASVTANKTVESELLQSVRRATSRFHSTTQALKAGHLPDDHCVSVPGLGGMGYHWVNPDLVDAEFDPLKPEAILYATGPGGNLRLVAVEYIVLDIGQDHPMFGSQLFNVGGTPVAEPHWSLHVWLYQDNPSGIFQPFNPNISCP